MATILDIGIDSANMGVYHPKMKNRWKVVFYQPGTSSATNSAVAPTAGHGPGDPGGA